MSYISMSEIIFTCTSWSFLLVPLRLLLGKPLFLLLLLLKDLQRLASAIRVLEVFKGLPCKIFLAIPTKPLYQVQCLQQDSISHHGFVPPTMTAHLVRLSSLPGDNFSFKNGLNHIVGPLVLFLLLLRF